MPWKRGDSQEVSTSADRQFHYMPSPGIRIEVVLVVETASQAGPSLAGEATVRSGVEVAGGNGSRADAAQRVVGRGDASGACQPSEQVSQYRYNVRGAGQARLVRSGNPWTSGEGDNSVAPSRTVGLLVWTVLTRLLAGQKRLRRTGSSDRVSRNVRNVSRQVRCRSFRGRIPSSPTHRTSPRIVHGPDG